MIKRKRVLIYSIIGLLVLGLAGLYYLYFTDQMDIFADFVTGPDEEVVSQKSAQGIYDSALVKHNLDVSDNKIVLAEEKDRGFLVDTVDIGEFKNIRRFMWDTSVPEGADFAMTIRTSADGENWGEWSEVGEENWYYLNLDQSFKKVQYLAEFSRYEITRGADPLTALFGTSVNDYDVERATENNEDEEGNSQSEGNYKRLYAHLYVDNLDYGRYIGSLVDRSDGDNYRLILLTDRNAYTTGMIRDDDYKNELSDFLTSRNNNINIYFVNEAKKVKKRIVGIAELAYRPADQMHIQSVEGSWQNKGDYLANFVDIYGNDHNNYSLVQMVDKGRNIKDGIYVEEEDANPRLKVKRNEDDSWQELVNQNSKRYGDLSKVKKMQNSTRMKFVEQAQGLRDYDPEGKIELYHDDPYAKLQVKEEEKDGYYVSSGVNSSGDRGDTFFPVWATSSQVWVGPGEHREKIFNTPCHTEGGDYTDIVNFALGATGVYDDLDGWIEDGMDFFEGGGNPHEQAGTFDDSTYDYYSSGTPAHQIPDEIRNHNNYFDEGGTPEGESRESYEDDLSSINNKEKRVVARQVASAQMAWALDDVWNTVEDVVVEPVEDVIHGVGEAGEFVAHGVGELGEGVIQAAPYMATGLLDGSFLADPLTWGLSYFGRQLMADMGDDIIEVFLGGEEEICGQLPPRQASAAYNLLPSVSVLRGLGSSLDSRLAQSDDEQIMDYVNNSIAQQLAISVKVKPGSLDGVNGGENEENGDEGPPSTTEQSPELLAVGVSAGYSQDEIDQPETVPDENDDADQGQPDDQQGTPGDVAGWEGQQAASPLKGNLKGLIKTGSDLLVMVVVTIIVVIVLIYLVSVLRKNDNFSDINENVKEDKEKRE